MGSLEALSLAGEDKRAYMTLYPVGSHRIGGLVVLLVVLYAPEACSVSVQLSEELMVVCPGTVQL